MKKTLTASVAAVLCSLVAACGGAPAELSVTSDSSVAIVGSESAFLAAQQITDHHGPETHSFEFPNPCTGELGVIDFTHRMTLHMTQTTRGYNVAVNGTGTYTFTDASGVVYEGSGEEHQTAHLGRNQRERFAGRIFLRSSTGQTIHLTEGYQVTVKPDGSVAVQRDVFTLTCN